MMCSLNPQNTASSLQNLKYKSIRLHKNGRSPTVKGVETIRDMPRPMNTSGIKRFLGLCSYFRDCIKNLSESTCHLRQLLRKNVKFHWSNKCEHKFNDLKHALLSGQVVLHYPDWTVPFQVHVDASKIGVRAMLAQEKDGHLRPVRFASRAFALPEGHWHTTHQEL